MRAIVICPLPPTLNDQIDDARASKYKSAQVKEEWSNTVETIAYTLPEFEGKIWLDFLWQVKNFRRDPDNICASAKYVMDGLKSAGKIQQDSLMVIQSPITNRYERTKGDDTLKLMISDRPIYEMTMLFEQEDLVA